MTFLLAVQNAFYSPAKYGYIREIAGKERLARANGMVQATTTTAILTGTFTFSITFELFLADVTFSTKQEVLDTFKPTGWFLVAGAQQCADPRRQYSAAGHTRRPVHHPAHRKWYSGQCFEFFRVMPRTPKPALRETMVKLLDAGEVVCPWSTTPKSRVRTLKQAFETHFACLW